MADLNSSGVYSLFSSSTVLLTSKLQCLSRSRRQSRNFTMSDEVQVILEAIFFTAVYKIIITVIERKIPLLRFKYPSPSPLEKKELMRNTEQFPTPHMHHHNHNHHHYQIPYEKKPFICTHACHILSEQVMSDNIQPRCLTSCTNTMSLWCNNAWIITFNVNIYI